MEGERQIKDDVSWAAQILCDIKHFQNEYIELKICNSCKTTKTPLWRKGDYNNSTNKWQLLCNACGLRYINRGCFGRYQCSYCGYVFCKRDFHCTGNAITVAKCSTKDCNAYNHVTCAQHAWDYRHSCLSSSSRSINALYCYDCISRIDLK